MKVLQFVGLIIASVIAYFVWFKPVNEVPTVSGPTIHRKPYNPFIIKSKTGKDVRIVAVYSLSPDGVKYSPEPTAPLIGSNKLEILKTNWNLIDIDSLTQYYELNGPYQDTLNGKSVTLGIGNYFTNLHIAQLKILEKRPYVNLYFVDGSHRYFDFSYPLNQNKKSYKVSRWSMSKTDKREILQHWRSVEKLLQPVIYRKDTILFMNRLERAIRSVRNITENSRTFNATAALAIEELINYSYTGS